MEEKEEQASNGIGSLAFLAGHTPATTSGVAAGPESDNTSASFALRFALRNVSNST